MKTIPNLHNFIGPLPADVLAEIEQLSIERHLSDGEPVYRQGDEANEMYQLLKGGVRMCNYSHDGKEIDLGNFKPGDCFGEVGMIDGMPRMSHALTIGPSIVRVLSKKHFDQLYDKHPEISKQFILMLCRRVRLLYSLTEEASTLNLHQRLARIIHRMSYSHGIQEDDKPLYIDTSQEELGRLLGASRQSISKELKKLEQEGSIEVRYGKVYVKDLESLNREYENLIGQEQVTPVYREK